MRVRERWCLVMLVTAAGTASGCGESGSGSGTIDLAISGGFSGPGFGATLHVDLDGPATRTTRDHGTQTTTLDPTTLADLRRKIDEARFPTLAPSYPGCCDFSVYDVTLEVESRSFHVVADGAAEIPAGFDALLGTLRDLVDRPLDWQ